MIIGGRTEVTWGRGAFIEPIKIILGGRITKTYIGKEIPYIEIISQTIKVYFKVNFPVIDFNKDIILYDFLTDYAGPGTIKTSKGSIASMFNPVDKEAVRGYERLVANDTSYCVSYAPYSRLERTVILIESYLIHLRKKKRYRWLGSDIKIMAVRNSSQVDVTMCLPQIAAYVPSLQKYKKNLDKINKLILKEFSSIYGKKLNSLSINTKDDYKMHNVYLTVSGSSLSGDIGVVGRGNRSNGLITSNRPMSLEGTNGKNPRYYSGFIYAIASRRIAQILYKTYKKRNSVEITSQNGGNLIEPWRVRVVIEEENEKEVKEIVKKELLNIQEITSDFVRRGIRAH